ncbi:MAG TPA: SLBB domain-containing protein [Verrucomicrobiae bacterium]
MKQIRLNAWLGLATALVAGCQSRGPQFDAWMNNPNRSAAAALLVSVPATNRVNPEWLRPAPNFFTLGPGDRLELEVFGDETTRTSTFVGPDGKIYFYLLPGLDVSGLTLAQTKALLERELTKYIREEPQLTLTLHSVESKRVWLLGRLTAPGVYPMNGPMTLLEAIALAGGPARAAPAALVGGASLTLNVASGAEDVADLRRSFVIRGGQFLPVDFHRLLREGDATQNIYLQPDDFVYVPSAVAREVYVLGSVAQPRAIAFKDQLTLVSAIGGAGGTIKGAYVSHVAIVRGSLTSPQIATVDFQNIIEGRTPDVLLEPHDIVYVPRTPYFILTRYLDIILDTFVRTVAANEGARAVVRGALPLGINVPIGVGVGTPP